MVQKDNISAEINIFTELKDIRNDIKDLSVCVTKVAGSVDELVNKTKEQEQKISSFSKFKNKIIAVFSTVNIISVIAISIIAIII